MNAGVILDDRCRQKVPESAPLRRYYFLDGLRGVAAILVVIYHLSQRTEYHVFRQAYYCVDIFFVLSGFVISANYMQKIFDDMRFSEFMALRLARLFPLFLFGLSLGTAALAAESAQGYTTLSLVGIAGAFLVNAFYLPFAASSSTTIANMTTYDDIFPANGPAWSLFFELFANALFFKFVFLSRRSQYAVVLASFIVFVAIVCFGKANSGWQAGNIVYGIPRVCYGFFVGAILPYFLFTDWYGDLRRYVRRHSLLITCAILFVLLVVVCYPFKGERLMMLVGITAAPGIVLLGSCIELSGSNKILDWLGQISYPIYCVHYPIMHVYNWVTGQPGQPLSIPLAVAEFVTALVLSQLLLLMYDTPIRRILREHVDRRFRPAPA